MSGVVKSVGKIFKKVGKIVKKIAPYIMIAAAIYFTGGAILAAAPALTGAAGAAGAAGAIGGGVAGATAGAGLAAGGASGWLSAFLGGSGSSVLGGLLSSSTVGSLVAGGARGLMQSKQMNDMEQFRIDEEERRVQRNTVNDSSLFDFSNPSSPSASPGLGVTTADLTSPTTVTQNTALSRPPRQSVVDLAQVTPPTRRFKYNHATGVIDFA